MIINLADTKYGIANSLKDTIYTQMAPATAVSTLLTTFFNRCKQLDKCGIPQEASEVFGIWKIILPIRDSSDKAREKNKRSSDIANNLKLNEYNLTTKEPW